MFYCFFSSGSGEEVDHDEMAPLTINIPDSPALRGPKSPVKAPKSPTKTGLAKKMLMSRSTSSKSQRVYQSGIRTLYTSGRPPWYDSHGSLKEPFVIGKIVANTYKYSSINLKG